MLLLWKSWHGSGAKHSPPSTSTIYLPRINLGREIEKGALTPPTPEVHVSKARNPKLWSCSVASRSDWGSFQVWMCVTVGVWTVNIWKRGPGSPWYFSGSIKVVFLKPCTQMWISGMKKYYFLNSFLFSFCSQETNDFFKNWSKLQKSNS